MRPSGTFKITNQNRDFARLTEAADPRRRRAERIIQSLRDEILEGGGGANLRLRRIFESPREIFRLEIQLPQLGYQRTTLLDRETLDELLQAEEVRDVIRASLPKK